jgi:deazaflavin-dependent oxidoreductase (nitroreductase family)
MPTRTAKLIAVPIAVLGAIATVFVVGMRTKSPVVLDAVRHCGRATKRFVLPTAGTVGSTVSIVRHVGRNSGRAFETPVQAVATDDGYVIALPYGLNTDWLKNVLASGSATIVHEGSTHVVDQPAMVSMAEAGHRFSSTDQRAHRLFRVEQCLAVRAAHSND